jgi:UDP-N-acetylglucosamine acyltransferase
VIHPTALIAPTAQIHPSATIGPYAIISGETVIQADCTVHAHAQLIGSVHLGQGSSIGHAAVIGADPQDHGFDTSTPSGVHIGQNNSIREHVTIHRATQPGQNTTLGDHNLLMVGSHLAHDVVIGNHNVIANAALLAGFVSLGNRSFIGGSAVFHQFIRIGDYCVIQGNGSFSKDIPHYCKAQRINRITGLNVIGLRRRGFDNAQRAELKQLFTQLFRSNQNLTQAITSARQTQWTPQTQALLDFVSAPTKKGICSLRPTREEDS